MIREDCCVLVALSLINIDYVIVGIGYVASTATLLLMITVVIVGIGRHRVRSMGVVIPLFHHSIPLFHSTK